MIANSNAYHTAPVVGDFMMVAELANADGSEYYWPQEEAYDLPESIQWYADGEAINGATLPVYNVSKYDVGKVLTAELTWYDQNGKEVTDTVSVGPTEAVVEGTLPIAGQIVDKATGERPDYAVADDTLTVQFTDPENAADPDAEYQWYRGTAAIAGATSAEYTVKKADEGKYLSVKVTRSDKKPVRVWSMIRVKKDISGATVEVKKTEATEIGDLDRFEVESVKLGKTELIEDEDYELSVYIDEVKDENLVDLDDMEDAAAAIGHKLVFVAEGEGDYYGQAVSEPTDVLTLAVGFRGYEHSINANALSGYYDAYEEEYVVEGKLLPNKSQLSATVFAGSYSRYVDVDVAYKWQKSYDGNTWVPISDATEAEYVVSSDGLGVENEAKLFRTIISSKDGFRVLEDSSIGYYQNTKGWSLDGTALVEGMYVVNTTNTTHPWIAARYPQPGDELTAFCPVGHAEDYMVYTWTLTDNDGELVGNPVKGRTYKVPETAKKGYDLEVTIEAEPSQDEFIADTDYDFDAEVQGKYTVELLSDVDKKENRDGVANPEVGDTLTVQLRDNETGALIAVPEYAEIVWLTDDEDDIPVEASKYVIDEDDYGKIITVVVTNGDDYYGAISTASTTNAVYDENEVNVWSFGDGWLDPSEAVLEINDVLVADMKYDTSDVTYTWTIKAGDGKEYTETGDTLRIERRYLGGSVTVTAAAPGLDPEKNILTKTFDLAVQDWAN
jgi:hypothetical protein